MKQLYVFLCALAPLCASAVEVLRVNEVGYLPDDVKVAVYLGDTDPATVDFRIGGSVPDSVVPAPAWGSIPYAARVYFSSAQSGEHSLTASKGSTLLASKTVRVADDAYSRFDLKELPLNYLRQQRCGYNPVQCGCDRRLARRFRLSAVSAHFGKHCVSASVRLFHAA